MLNAEPFYEFVPQLRFFFVTQHISGSRRGNAEHPFVSDTILHPRPLSTTILFISKLQMLTASHYPSLCLITNASYIVIIAWNLSAIGSRRIQTIIVESSYFQDELIERWVKSITRDTSRISFFLKFYIGKFYIFGKIDLWNVRRMYHRVL